MLFQGTPDGLIGNVNFKILLSPLGGIGREGKLFFRELLDNEVLFSKRQFFAAFLRL